MERFEGLDLSYPLNQVMLEAIAAGIPFVRNERTPARIPTGFGSHPELIYQVSLSHFTPSNRFDRDTAAAFGAQLVDLIGDLAERCAFHGRNPHQFKEMAAACLAGQHNYEHYNDARVLMNERMALSNHPELVWKLEVGVQYALDLTDKLSIMVGTLGFRNAFTDSVQSHENIIRLRLNAAHPLNENILKAAIKAYDRCRQVLVDTGYYHDTRSFIHS